MKQLINILFITSLGAGHRIVILCIIICFINSSCTDAVETNHDCKSCGPLPQNEYIADLYYFSPSLGWAVTILDTVAYASVYQTTDGGLNWIRQINGVLSISPTIQFINQFIGWIGVNKGIILKTTNGGWNWRSIQITDSTRRISSIYFIDNNRGWATTFATVGLTGLGEIYYSTDGGESWLLQYISEGGAFTSIYAIDDHVWAVGGGVVDPGDVPLVVYSSDGGKNYSIADLSGIHGPQSKVLFINQQIGFSGGFSGIFLSQDSGKSWSQSTTKALYDIVAVNDDGNTLRVAGREMSIYQSMIFNSTDMGTSWTTEWQNPVDTLRIINRLFFLNGSTGWAAGLEYDSLQVFSHPILMKYENGNWRLICCD